MLEPDALFTREEILRGREPVRQARSLLFLIESRTAYRASRARHAAERFPTEIAAHERDLAFLESYVLGREPKEAPTVQDIERYVEYWRDLVPDNPRVRASLARLLGEKYRLSYESIPGIRDALALDDPAVQEAFQRFTGKPIRQLFAEHLSWRERLRWRWSALAQRLESMPPFWTTYALTLTEALSGGILALPIAVAGLGPLAGLLVIVILGLINVVTIGSLAESLTRSGPVRYDNAYFGRMVGAYLGRAGSVLLTATLFPLCILICLMYYQGVATTLADATGIPPVVWAVALFAMVLFFVTRPSLSSTVASALVIGAFNVLLLAIIALIALRYFDPAHFAGANVLDAASEQAAPGPRLWQPAPWASAIGVVLTTYYGHVSVGNCGRLVLSRDPSGRSLIWGSMAALATTAVLCAGFVLVVMGAVPADRLMREGGTVLITLAEQAGPSVRIIGSLFAVLSMGLAIIHSSLGLFNLTRERLPGAMPGPLVPEEGGDAGGITMSALLSLPDLERRVAALLLRRGERSLSDLAAELEVQDDALGAALARLRQLGYVEERTDDRGQLLFRARLGRRSPARAGRAALWGMLDEWGGGERSGPSEQWPGGRPRRHRARGIAGRAGRRPGHTLVRLAPRMARWSEGTRFWVALSPIIGTFAVAVWLLVSGAGTFTQVVNFTGVFAVTVGAGFFPLWLVASSRRKGDIVPGIVHPLLGHPVVVGALYLVFLGHLLLHGLVIWRGQVAGVVSLGLAAAMVVLTVVMARSGAFDRHAAVELRATDGGSGFFAVTAGGQHPEGARVIVNRAGSEGEEEVLDAARGELPDLAALRGLRFRFPAAGMKAIGIRVHKVGPSGESEPLPCSWEVSVAPGSAADGPSGSGPSSHPETRRLAAGRNTSGAQSIPLPPESAPMVDVTLHLRG